MNYADMGQRIRKRRIQLGITQDELARQMGVSLSFIGHLERGTRKASIDTLVALSNTLSISTDSLLAASINRSPDALEEILHLEPEQRAAMSEVFAAAANCLAAWEAAQKKHQPNS